MAEYTIDKFSYGGNIYNLQDSNAAAVTHSHGDITSSGDITATAPTIASGDKLIINDESESKITNGPSFGSDTTKFLRNDGEWATPPGTSVDMDTTYTLGTTGSGSSRKVTLTAGGSGSGTQSVDVPDTTYSDFTGATSSAAGAHGLVPAPTTSERNYYLRGTGIWSYIGIIADGGLIQSTSENSLQFGHKTYGEINAAAVKVGRDAFGHVVTGGALTYSDVGASATGHKHAAEDITSGTLPIERGGTGVSAVYPADVLTGLFDAAAEDYGAVYFNNDTDSIMIGGALPVAYGGTGAYSAANARTNLGAQETLVSGTNIKTINNQSLLGSGNITISGSGETYSDFTGATTSAAGAHGLVPAPAAGSQDWLLAGRGLFRNIGIGVARGEDSAIISLMDYTLSIAPFGIGNSAEIPAAGTNGVAGLMLAADKTKLDGIAENANNYTHPAYTTATAAAVKVGRDAAGHVVIGSALTASDVGASATGHKHAAEDITSGTLGTARIPNLAASKITSGTMSQLRVQPIYYQAHGSGSINLTAGTVTKVTLASTGALSSGSGLAIASGGIKITTAGRYRITASAYVQNTTTAANGRGVYVCKVASSGAFSTTAEIFAAVDARGGASSGAICCGPKIVACAANDIVYLAARSIGAAGTCEQDNGGTYLLVERLS